MPGYNLKSVLLFCGTHTESEFMVEQAALHAMIYGRVQGVFFRGFVFEKARILELTGSVRNLPAGQVEVKAEGTRENLAKLIGYLKTGPPSAIVTDLKIQWSSFSGKYPHFTILD